MNAQYNYREMKNSESQSTPENWEDGTGGYFSYHLNGALHENLTSIGFFTSWIITCGITLSVYCL